MISGDGGDGSLSLDFRLRHFLSQSLPGDREDRQSAHRSHSASEQVCYRVFRSRLGMLSAIPFMNNFFNLRHIIKHICGLITVLGVLNNNL